MNRAVRAALLLAGILAFAYLAAPHLAPRAGSGAAAALAESGRATQESAVSLPLSLKTSETRPAMVLLVDTRPLLAPEREALEDYVAEGGDLWVLGPAPERALWPDLGAAPRVLHGVVFASDGTPPAVRSPEGDERGTAPGTLALDVADAAWAPELRVGAEAFRDTNGDGRIQTAEPAGPFVVGVVREVGLGRVHVVGVAPDVAGAAETIARWASSDAPLGPALVADENAHAPWLRVARSADGVAALPALAWMPAAAILVTAGALGGLLLLRARRAQTAAEAALDPLRWLDRQREARPDYHQRLQASLDRRRE